MCPELSNLKSESVPGVISKWLKAITTVAAEKKDADGKSLYEIPQGITGSNYS